MRLAVELGLPLMTVIDTPGAALSPEAEEGGLAGEIARCLSDLVTLRAPTLCLMLGEGNGGGALALLPADRVVAAQHAWLSPLPPEGASAIVHRDVEHAPDMARDQHVRSTDLRAGRHGRPDRRREAGRGRRARGVLPPGGRGAALGARPAVGPDPDHLVRHRTDRFAHHPLPGTLATSRRAARSPGRPTPRRG